MTIFIQIKSWKKNFLLWAFYSRSVFRQFSDNLIGQVFFSSSFYLDFFFFFFVGLCFQLRNCDTKLLLCSALLQRNNNVFNTSVFQTIITFKNDHRVLISINQEREESKSLERQRQSNLTISIGTKFRKVVQENRMGVLQGVLIRLTTSKDEIEWFTRYDVASLSTFGTDHDWNAWSRNVFAHNTIFLSRHWGATFLLKDIWIDDKSYISDTFLFKKPILLRKKLF